MNSAPTLCAAVLDRFQQDTKQHVMTILHDAGLHRSLRLARPDSMTYSFQITTWPGHLAISGDMGCYVFHRLEDMFTFHRGQPELGWGRFDPDYWAEKLVAVDRSCAAREFSPARFAEVVREELDEYLADLAETEDVKDALRQQLSHAIRCAADGEALAREALAQVGDRVHHPFRTSWELDFSELTPRYLWCCCAIEWAIACYDGAQARAAARPAPPPGHAEAPHG